MRCPRCGYTSFDHLDSCKKCGDELGPLKEKLGLRSLFSRALKKGTALPGDAVQAPEPGIPPEGVPTLPDVPAEGADAPPAWSGSSEPLPLFFADSPPDSGEPGAEEGTGTLAGSEEFFPGEEPLPAEADSGPDEAAADDETSPGLDPDQGEDEGPLPSGYFSEKGPSPLTRLAATLADLALLTSILALFLLAGNAILFPEGPLQLLPPLEELLLLSTPYFLVLFCACFGYFTLFHYLVGQTPGKMALGLRVESRDGGALSPSQAFLRSVGGLMALLSAGIGYLPILLDREGRGLNDRLAGTRVRRGRD